MSSLRPEVTFRTSDDDLEPLAVSPRQACRLINVGITYLYDLINNNELESYVEGRRARKITMRSIRARQERLLAAARGAVVTTETAQPRRRGRPPKMAAHKVWS
jgi:hypothetical protein